MNSLFVSGVTFSQPFQYSNPGLGIADDLLNFLVLLVVGFLIALILDLFRSLRRASKHYSGKKHFTALVHTEDALFLAISFCILVLALNVADFGRIRFYMILGAVVGGVLYFLAISPWLVRVFTWIFQGLLGLVWIPVKFGKRVFLYFQKRGKIFLEKEKNNEKILDQTEK